MSVCLTSSSTLLRHTSLLPCNVTHAFHELQSETFFALISKNNWTDDVWVFSDGLDIPVWWKEGSEPLNADKSITDNDKVNRCLARYSLRATTANQPTNRALNKRA